MHHVTIHNIIQTGGINLTLVIFINEVYTSIIYLELLLKCVTQIVDQI